MREILEHKPGKIYLIVLVLSIVVLLVVIGAGFMTTPEGAEPVLIFGWITLPLAAGIVFVLVWLIAYLVYFFKYWPYR